METGNTLSNFKLPPGQASKPATEEKKEHAPKINLIIQANVLSGSTMAGHNFAHDALPQENVIPRKNTAGKRKQPLQQNVILTRHEANYGNNV